MNARECRTVHVIVPVGIDDPTAPSGGNVYDRKVCQGLAAAGWSVTRQAVPGDWPWPDETGYRALAELLAAVPDDEVVMIDGLIASTADDVLVPHARRLRLVVLVHMPIGTGQSDGRSSGLNAWAREQSVLSSALAVIVTSAWAQGHLLNSYGLQPDRMHIAEPGVDPAELADETPTGGEFLCVAAVTPVKGHDVLLAALGEIADLSWRCRWAGSLTRDPAFVARLARQMREIGIDDRVTMVGPLAGPELESIYATADLLIAASRFETYGMVVTEALARGIPVVAGAVGGLGEALGYGGSGTRPGRLVPPADPIALAATLRDWLGDEQLRLRLRRAAGERRVLLSGWGDTSARISGVLAGVAR